MYNEMQTLPERWKTFVDHTLKGVRSYLDGINQIAYQQMNGSSDVKIQLSDARLQLTDALQRVNEERARRKLLHNTLVELRGNIRVYCRVRPLLASLDSNGNMELLGRACTGSEKIVDVLDEENVSISHQQSGNTASIKVKEYEYERVFDPAESQSSIFTDVAPLLTSLLDGYNVCVMAYGQTGSGKTHTMVGDHDLIFSQGQDPDNKDSVHYAFIDERSNNISETAGIIPRAAQEIFRLMKERESSRESYHLEVCVFEVYNNEIVDLLAPPSKRNQKHGVFSDSDGSQEIPSLTTDRLDLLLK